MKTEGVQTPAATLIDHNLIMELGLKITDLQCKKISFAGWKLRLLGKISTTVQCIKDGKIFANIQLRASVVEDLKDVIDSHCIAGRCCFPPAMFPVLMRTTFPRVLNPPGREGHHVMIFRGHVPGTWDLRHQLRARHLCHLPCHQPHQQDQLLPGVHHPAVPRGLLLMKDGLP